MYFFSMFMSVVFPILIRFYYLVVNFDAYELLNNKTCIRTIISYSIKTPTLFFSSLFQQELEC